MTSLNQLDAIIFDLGNVLVHLDFEESFRRFQAAVPSFDRHAFLGTREQHSLFSGFETGHIDSAQLLARFNQHFKSAMTLEEFTDSLNAMILSVSAPRLALVDRLRARGLRVYVLSNINEIHEREVEERYRLLALGREFFSHFDQVYYSHQIGHRKPDAEAFELILREHSLSPSRTLFVDDSEQHIVAARALGLQTLHLKPGMELVEQPVFAGV